ncbi:MAG: hypothetical protein WCA98_16235 [Candidatus Acidiferrales bacterium]
MKLTRRESERGAGKLAGFLFLVVLAAAVFAAVKIVPVYVNNFELQDSIETESRFAVANRKSPDDIQTDVFKKVKDLGIPADKKDIHIKFSGGGEPGMPALVEIDVDYQVNVVFPGYTLPLNFHTHADNHSI